MPKDSDFSGLDLQYDDSAVVPTPGVYPVEQAQASLQLLPASLGSHDVPSPFETGIQRDPGYDVMPMPALTGNQQQWLNPVAGIPPEIMPSQMGMRMQPRQRRGIGTVEEVQAGMHKHMAGLAILLAGGGAAVGYTQGGAYGALAGSLFGGSAVNAYRAFKFYMDGSEGGAKEAIVSGTYALVAVAAGGFLWYKFVHEKKHEAIKNPECDKDLMGSNPCGIRRAGP
jgi:hypothetical protein